MAIIWAPRIGPLSDTRLEREALREVRDGSTTDCRIEGRISKGKDEGRWVWDAGDERFPTILVEPGVVGAAAIGLDIVETGDGGESNSRIEQRPSVCRLEPIGTGLVDIDFKEGSCCCKRGSYIAMGKCQFPPTQAIGRAIGDTHPFASETRDWYWPGMNLVAVNDQSCWFHVEMPLVVEKSVWASAGQLSTAAAAIAAENRIVSQLMIQIPSLLRTRDTGEDHIVPELPPQARLYLFTDFSPRQKVSSSRFPRSPAAAPCLPGHHCDSMQ